MKKLTKVLSVVMITIMMVSYFSTAVLAIATDPNTFDGKSNTIDSSQINGFMNSVINIVSMVGSAVAIIALIILGIKYMMGSAEEKAEYKKSFVPLLVGAILVFGAATVAKIIVGLAGSF